MCVGPSNKSGEQALLDVQRPPSVENFTVRQTGSTKCVNRDSLCYRTSGSVKTNRPQILRASRTLDYNYRNCYDGLSYRLGEYTVQDLSQDLQTLCQPSDGNEVGY